MVIHSHIRPVSGTDGKVHLDRMRSLVEPHRKSKFAVIFLPHPI